MSAPALALDADKASLIRQLSEEFNHPAQQDGGYDDALYVYETGGSIYALKHLVNTPSGPEDQDISDAAFHLSCLSRQVERENADGCEKAYEALTEAVTRLVARV